MVMLVISASTLLLYFILTHQYQYDYVYNYSNSDLPTGLLLSTFWAGQEGSFLLWILMTALIGIGVQSYTEKRGDLEPRVMMVFTLVTTFLLIMICPLLKNPFALIWQGENPYIELKYLNQELLRTLTFVPNYLAGNQGADPTHLEINGSFMANLASVNYKLSDILIMGKGLNPLLQNFWMQIHPPILFAGFAIATVPFSYAISALIKNDYKDWARQALPWILACAGILGLGIMLGGYWAYGVLGWGGYWAWDPVENSSLVPWIVSVAVIHTILVQIRTQKKEPDNGRYLITNLILTLLIFVLVIYSTFLTRSGILAESSVHSFAAAGNAVYYFLVVFVGFFTVFGIGMVLFRLNSLLARSKSGDESTLSRELSLFMAAFSLGVSAFIVLAGTSAPIFGVKVEVSFYNMMHVPLMIIVMAINGLSVLLKWKSTDISQLYKDLIRTGIITIVLSVAIIIIGGVDQIMMILLLLFSMFSLVVNFEVMLKIIKGSTHKLGSYIAHIGMAIFVLGVIGSSAFSTEQEIDLEKGKVAKVLGYDVTFAAEEPFQENGNNKSRFVLVVKSESDSAKVKPVMYEATMSGSLMREPDMKYSLLSDFYVSPLGITPATAGKGDVLSIHAAIKPMINLVWLGVLVVVIGFCFSTFRRWKETRE
jgi:cytochrome c-type biogenesis protein CcmF